MKTHNLSGHPLYTVWAQIKSRCSNPKATGYERYGGRGIEFWDVWKKNFQYFYNWCIENGWTEGLTIDRIANNGNYFPSNIRFVSIKTQANNTRRNKLITLDGETKTLKQWSEHTGIGRTTLKKRLELRWTIDQVLNKSLRLKKHE